MVVLDPGHGSWAGRCLDYFSALFPEARFSALHDKPDGNFPDRHPDSAKPEHLARLSARVRSEGADLGIAFDGDGDRVSFVDQQGIMLTAEQATWMLLGAHAEEIIGRTMVHDVKFSDLIPETVETYGGLCVMERSGHAFLRRAMKHHNALFGAEVSGHYFYEELDGGDDGFYSAARMLCYLAASGQRLAEGRAQCPPVYMTPDLRLRLSEAEQRAVLAEARQAFEDHPVNTVDGLRVTFTGGWALIRASVTEAALTFRFEGESWGDLDEVVSACCGKLGTVGAAVRDLYEQSKSTSR